MGRGRKEVRKEPVDFRINESTIMETEKPIDYSFKMFRKLSDVAVEGAKSSRLGGLAAKSTETQKFLTRAVWLNNNKLTSIEYMNMFVESVLHSPEELAWIDFSFNYIKTIDDIILNYKNLKIIYFHGNLISDIDEVKKLRDLTELKSITFHGNPITKIDGYRGYIITYLPQVQTIDMIPVLKSERLTPAPQEALKKLSKDLGFDDEDDDDKDWVAYIKDKRHKAVLKKIEDEIDMQDDLLNKDEHFSGQEETKSEAAKSETKSEAANKPEESIANVKE